MKSQLKCEVNEQDTSVLLEAVGVSLAYGGVHAVENVSLKVRAGRLVGLIGPNGAGKSTLLTILAGGLRPSSGSVMFDGTDITRYAPHRRARMGLVRTFQLGGDLPRLTVLENLLFGAPGQRGERLLFSMGPSFLWRKQEEELVVRARALLDSFDMRKHENHYVHELSGGQRRLVEIMRALMARPRLLLLDEPLAGVNPSLGRRIEEHLVQLQKDGLTMVLVEHELGIVERCCDPVVVMANGSIIGEGVMADMRVRREVLDAYLAG